MSLAWESSSPVISPDGLPERPRNLRRRTWILIASVCILLAWPARANAYQLLVTLAGGGATVTFADTALGQSATQTVPLNLDSSITLVSATTGGDFSITDSGGCLLGAAPHPPRNPDSVIASCILVITFTSTVPGARWGPLVAIDSNGNRYSFGLQGTGIGPLLTFPSGMRSVVAGTGTAGYTGDTGPAVDAQLQYPTNVALDANGNLYIADALNHAVRRLDADGNITTFAGGSLGYGGDGGPATSAQLNEVTGVAVDSSGNVYIADSFNCTIRRVNANGIISSVAGMGPATCGHSGDGGPASAAQINPPWDVAVDGAGNMYFSENYNHDVRKVDVNGTITTIVGTGTAGYNGDGQMATNAQLNQPFDLALDAAGNLYIADSNNFRVRRVDSRGNISTVAGNGTSGSDGDEGTASDAQLSFPEGLAVDAAGGLYISDSGKIRFVNSQGKISTAPNTQSLLARGLRLDGGGKLYLVGFLHQLFVLNMKAAAVLHFGNVPVGTTSSAQTLAIMNAGNADLQFTQISADPNFPIQGGSGSCSTASAAPAGTACNLAVAFQPSSLGSIEGSAALTGNAPQSSQTVNSDGTGVTPPASKIVFNGSFSTITVGGNLGTVTVNVEDSSGNVVTSSATPVGLQLSGPSGFTTLNTSSNPSSGVATFDLSAVALSVVGSYAITANSVGLTSAEATFNAAAAPDFSFDLASSSVMVVSGANGIVDLTLLPTGGFTGTISLSCSGLPIHSVCSFNPAVLNADGSNTALPSAMTVDTGVASVGQVLPRRSTWLLAAGAIPGIGFLCLVLVPTGGDRRRRAARLKLCLLSLLLLIAALSACSSGSAVPVKLTPAGDYTVSITGTAGSARHSDTVTLRVQ